MLKSVQARSKLWLRRWVEPRGDKRRYQGVIAGAIMSDKLREYILQHGLYAIEQAGDTVKINDPGKNIREW